jgi:hypothetical protein
MVLITGECHFGAANPPVSCAEGDCYCDALGTEQASSIQKYFWLPMLERDPSSTRRKSVRLCYITSEWAVIWFPSELLTGKKFRHLLQDPHSCSMVKWVVVDELHLVSNNVELQ